MKTNISCFHSVCHWGQNRFEFYISSNLGISWHVYGICLGTNGSTLLITHTQPYCVIFSVFIMLKIFITILCVYPTRWWLHYPIEAGRCIYASVNGFRIGPDNGLSPDRRQAIIRANADLVSVRPTEKNWLFQSKYNNFVRKWIWICPLQYGGHFAKPQYIIIGTASFRRCYQSHHRVVRSRVPSKTDQPVSAHVLTISGSVEYDLNHRETHCIKIVSYQRALIIVLLICVIP